MERVLAKMLFDRIRKHGCDPILLDEAVEVVIFGSCAVGLHSTDSDLDVLCIGNGRRLKSSSLDLSWQSEKDIGEDEWLASELAGHIAKYGVWLRGEGHWRAKVFGGAYAIKRKEKRILSLSRTVIRLWDRLHPLFREQYNVTIRRELQRLALLKRQMRIPPTKLLDDEWCLGKHHDLLVLRRSIGDLSVYEGQSKAPKILTISV